MNQWHQVASLLYGYAALAAIALVVLCALRALLSDVRLSRRMKKNTPQVGAAGSLCVMTAARRRFAAGQEIRVPYEGTLGSSHSCDVCIPYRRVHLRSAFFWMERDGLHMVALHRDGFFVDDVSVEPGDEAILREGAILRVGEIKLRLSLYEWAYHKGRSAQADPYVTTARRSRAQQGRGDGIGAPGKGELRREKRMDSKRKKTESGARGKMRGAAAPQKKNTRRSAGEKR